MSDVLTLRVRQWFSATPLTRILRLSLDGARFEFAAGQSARLGLHGQPLSKPYSIACAPEDARRLGYLEFLVKVETSGDAGAHLTNLRRGAAIDLRGPTGRFRFPEQPAERRFLFIAGGTGIAPLRAMLRHALAARVPGCFGVAYSARSPDEFAYGRELRQLARTGRIDLLLTVTREARPTWRGARGRIDLDHLAPIVRGPDTLCFLCGPPSLLGDVTPLLRRLGVPPARILTEEW